MGNIHKSGKNIRVLDASDERQYMINEDYEVYEKQGAPVGAMTFHYHNFYEIIYIMEGEFSSLVEERLFTLRKGDFLLIDRNVMHKYHYVEKKHDSSIRIILWITDQMLQRLSEDGVELSRCFEGNGSKVYHFPIYYEEILRGFLLKLAMSELLDGEAAGTRKIIDKGYLSLFFGYLNVLCGRSEYIFAGDEIRDHPLVQQVSEYIETHMEGDIYVEDIADYVHMSKYYFLRKFKELTGLTVHGFLVNKRLIRACDDIRNGSSISDAWQKAGFADYSSFLRNFKRVYGISPREYRELV